MRRSRIPSCTVSVLALIGALVGCTSDAQEPSPRGAPPNEPVVFEASNETTSEIGVVRWGFATDEEGDLMTYRGYGERDDVVATVVQAFDRRDPNVYHFTMTMTGSRGSASERIDFSARPSADGRGSEIVLMVTENSFAEGSFPSRVLVRFKEDAAKRKGTTVGTGSLTGKARPLGETLVTPCGGTVDRCQMELIDERIAANGESGSCSLLNTVGQPLLACATGALIGALVAWWTGPGVVGAAIGACAGGAGTGAVSAATQCLASRQDANAAAEKLFECRRATAAQCTE